jgi:hypothetical protein
MITPTKDATLILLALIAILGAGFGMGRLAGRPPVTSATPPSVTFDELETKTLLALRDTLDLTPEQEALLLPEVQANTEAVLATRERAVHDFHLQMLQLHDRLAPHLNPRQQEILQENRDKLQDSIDQRFSSLLNANPLDPLGAPDPTPPSR